MVIRRIGARCVGILPLDYRTAAGVVLCGHYPDSVTKQSPARAVMPGKTRTKE